MESQRQQEQGFLTEGLSSGVYSWTLLGIPSVLLEKKMVSFN